MLTRFLSNSFIGIVELLMWFVVVSGIFIAVGSGVTGDTLFDAGIGLVLSLVFSAVVFGPIMIVIDLKKSVANIERMLANRE